MARCFSAVGLSDSLVPDLVTRSDIVGSGTDRTDVYRRGRKIVVSIAGHHTADSAAQASRYLVALVSDINGPVEVIADMSRITGFTGEARPHWQAAFKQVRHHIRLITLVQGTALARMTASAVGLYAGIKIRSTDTLDDALREAK
jgi:hypothetical protein